MFKILDLVAHDLYIIKCNDLEKKSIWIANDKIDTIVKCFPTISFAQNRSANIINDKKLKLQKDLDNLFENKKYNDLILKLSSLNKIKNKHFKQIGILDTCNRYINDLIKISYLLTEDIFEIVYPEKEDNPNNSNKNIKLINDKNLKELTDTDISSIKEKFGELSLYYKEVSSNIKNLSNLQQIKENYNNTLAILCSYVKECCKQITGSDNESNQIKLSKRTKRKYYNAVKKLRKILAVKNLTDSYHSSLERAIEVDRDEIEGKIIVMFNKIDLNNSSFKAIIKENLEKLKKSEELIDSDEYYLKSWKDIFRFVAFHFNNLEQMIENNPLSIRDTSKLKQHYKIVSHTKDIMILKNYLPNENKEKQINLKTDLENLSNKIYKKICNTLERFFRNISKYCDYDDNNKFIDTLQKIKSKINEKNQLENQLSG